MARRKRTSRIPMLPTRQPLGMLGNSRLPQRACPRGHPKGLAADEATVSGLPALPRAALEHVTRILANSTEHRVVIGAGAFGFVTVLHGPADDDVPLPAE